MTGFCNHWNDKIAPCRPPRSGGVRRSDGSDVGCSHTEACPLFPLLNASLRGWSESYCESETRWRECARYKLASKGQLVPISLLPSGADAGHIRSAAERSATAEPTPPAPVISEVPGTVGWFEPTPAPAQPREPAPPSAVPQYPGQSQDRAEHPREQRKREKRRWWRRFADWMRGPA